MSLGQSQYLLAEKHRNYDMTGRSLAFVAATILKHPITQSKCSVHLQSDCSEAESMLKVHE